MRRWCVYNLEFRDWVTELTIAGHRFVRVPQYLERVVRLQHLIHISSDEVSKPAHVGEHAVTAICEAPDDTPSILESNPSLAIQDITLLLSLFTGRHVFVAEHELDPSSPELILRDPFRALWGGTLEVSLPRTTRSIPAPARLADLGTIAVDTSLETGLNHVYGTMCTEIWRRRFKDGWVLKMAFDAFRERRLEAAFVQCWTIWEHLFAILNEPWLSDRNRSIRAAEKIAFVLVHFALRSSIDNTSRERIQRIADLRNQLVHAGRLDPNAESRQSAELFVHLTEYVLAMVLDLAPWDIYESLQGLERHLAQRTAQRGHA